MISRVNYLLLSMISYVLTYYVKLSLRYVFVPRRVLDSNNSLTIIRVVLCIYVTGRTTGMPRMRQKRHRVDFATSVFGTRCILGVGRALSK